MPSEYYIYRITNTINGKTYIGQRKFSSDPELDKYKGSGKLLWRAYSKYGFENFTKDIIRRYINTREEADESEKFYIYIERLSGHSEYNISDGGTGGNLGPLVNKLHSDTLKELFKDDNYMIKFRTYSTGKTQSDKTRMKHSNTIKEKWKNDEEYRLNQSISRSLAKLGDKNPMYGKSPSEATRKLIGESSKSNWTNPEFRSRCIRYGNTNVRGRIWINNGINCRMIYPDEVVPQGWVKGRIKKHNS